jgi:cell wall-associated NlpC family hydrolase
VARQRQAGFDDAMRRPARLLPVVIATLLGGAAAQETPEQLVAAAKARLAPDRRTTVFDVVAQRDGDKLVLRGEVHDQTLRKELVAFVGQHAGCKVVDELTALPDPALGERTHGIVSVSVANLRAEPAHAAELGTQALLGTPLAILKQKGDWLYVQTPNRYLCWTQDRVAVMDPAAYRDWSRRDKVIVTATFAVVRDEAGEPVSDAVAGCILALEGATASDFRVRYPDGRTGVLARDQAAPFVEWLAQAAATPERIVGTARRFLGVPYLWGGTSTKGMDCSGFTSTVYLLNGVVLPRDASQQVRVGVEVEPGDGFANVQPGDLLFFGSAAAGDRPERVRHVAIALGGPRFIHASVDVRRNSLDPAAPDYSNALRKSLLRVKRVIGAGTGVALLRDIPYYVGR